jgi:hypothetical protein
VTERAAFANPSPSGEGVSERSEETGGEVWEHSEAPGMIHRSPPASALRKHPPEKGREAGKTW